MSTELWALIVSIVALSISIGVPIWQHLSSKSRTIEDKRNMLLQKLLEAKSINYLATQDLRALLDRHGGRMEPEQRTNLQAALPRMQQHSDVIEDFYKAWIIDRDGKPTLSEINDGIRAVNVIYSEARDTAALIQSGKESFQ